MCANPATFARKPGLKLLAAAGGLATLVSLSPYAGLVVELDANQVTEGSCHAVQLEHRIRAVTSIPVRFEHVDGGYVDR